MKANAKYQVHVGSNRRGARYVYFATLEAASKFCNEVCARTGIVLSIVEMKSC